MTVLAWGLTAVALASAARAVSVTGRRLLIALPVMMFGVGCVNPLIEAVAFGVMPLADVPQVLIAQAFLATVLSTAIIVLLGKWRENDQRAVSVPVSPLRLAAAACCYVILYVAAGMAVFPYVKDFYATKTLPAFSTIAGLQLARGAFYVLYVWPWMRLAPKHTGVALGFVYAVTGGVAPLLAEDNPYMPRNIRMAHLVEIGISNFVFGLIVARLLQSNDSARLHVRSTAASVRG